MANIRQIKGKQFDVREMMLAAGIGEYTAQMAMQYAFFLPRTSDPYAQGVMLLVEGLQRLLNKRGEQLEVDGGMGPETVDAIKKYSGARWFDKNWIQLYGDVLQGDNWRGYERAKRGQTKKALAAWEESLGDAPHSITSMVPTWCYWVLGGLFYIKEVHPWASRIMKAGKGNRRAAAKGVFLP